MGDLFYNQSLTGFATTHNADYILFISVQSDKYWSGSENQLPKKANYFDTRDGTQNSYFKPGAMYALAVRSGDVAAVPVPGAVWLFGSVMVGLMGLKRRGNIG